MPEHTAVVMVHVEASSYVTVDARLAEANAALRRELLGKVAAQLREAGLEIRNAIVSVNYADGFAPRTAADR